MVDENKLLETYGSYVCFSYLYGAIEDTYAKLKTEGKLTGDVLDKFIGELMYFERIHLPYQWEVLGNIDSENVNSTPTTYDEYKELITNEPLSVIIRWIENCEIELMDYQRFSVS